MTKTYNILVALTLLCCASAAATDPATSRNLLNSRRLNGPSDLLNDLLQDVNQPLIKTLGHLKFKDYNKHGYRLGNLRTFAFDVDGGQLLKGKLSDDLKSVALSVAEFQVRLHSRWKRTSGLWRPGGQCDFQIKDVKAKVSGDIASLSPFRFKNVKVDVQPGRIIPSCDGLAGAIINVAVHLFSDIVMPRLHNTIDKTITQILEKGTGQSLLEQRLSSIWSMSFDRDSHIGRTAHFGALPMQEALLSSSYHASSAASSLDNDFFADVLSSLDLPSESEATASVGYHGCDSRGSVCEDDHSCCHHLKCVNTHHIKYAQGICGG